jgi:phthiocerol/phenolphthiocerol synthesis type-I polyketide synthase E
MPAYSPSSIAIIGLSGRFPDAPDVPRFWRNLEQGLESLNSFSDSELREAGVPQSLLENPNYVKK